MPTEPLKVEAEFEKIFDRAMRSQPQIQHIVLASEQGLTVASKSAVVRGKENRLAALAPVLSDAGESLFAEVGLSPLSEMFLVGGEGTVYETRLKSAPVFLLIAAKGQVNIGLLRMIAGQIETQASEVLRTLM